MRSGIWGLGQDGTHTYVQQDKILFELAHLPFATSSPVVSSDSAFLAEESKAAASNTPFLAKFRVMAMDQRYRSLQSTEMNTKKDITTSKDKEEEVEECTQFWKRRGIEMETRCVSVHWGNQTQPHASWFQQQQQQPNTKLLCLFLVRFWNQSLMEFLANSSTSLVKEGTLVAVSQFAKPHPGASWNFDHPKVRSTQYNAEVAEPF